MDYSNITVEDLKKQLLEKHKKQLVEAKTTLTNIDRIKILTEKLDQLTHWVEESKGKKKDAYAKRKEAAETELAKLKGETTITQKSSAKQLEEKIRDHEKAIEHWKKK